jgi:hypothetical protein
MSHALFQFLLLFGAALLVSFWKRHRSDERPVREGFYIVRWQVAMRVFNAVFLALALASFAYLLRLSFFTDEKGAALILALSFPVVALAIWSSFEAWGRCEYNDTTLIMCPTIGKPRQFALRDFTRVGPVGWRGHEFSTESGERIYLKSYQLGAPALIEVLRQQARETDLE